MNCNRIILASQSPRRIEIMKNHGLDPIVMPADVDETLPEGIGMEDAVMFLSLKKALSIEAAHPELAGSLIIAADTVVYKDGIMGKPEDRADAFRMIDSIRNTSHYVATGVSLVVAGKPLKRSFCAITEVFCRDYTEADINGYIDTDEPYDKAGGYAIQGAFGKFIDHIDGDYENVVGLPFARMMKEIEAIS